MRQHPVMVTEDLTEPRRAPCGALLRRAQPRQTLTGAVTLRQVSHGAIQFMVYEDLKERATRPAAGASRAPPSSAEITAIGAVSKLAASIATYPSQARRRRRTRALRQRWCASRLAPACTRRHALLQRAPVRPCGSRRMAGIATLWWYGRPCANLCSAHAELACTSRKSCPAVALQPE